MCGCTGTLGIICGIRLSVGMCILHAVCGSNDGYVIYVPLTGTLGIICGIRLSVGMSIQHAVCGSNDGYVI